MVPKPQEASPTDAASLSYWRERVQGHGKSSPESSSLGALLTRETPAAQHSCVSALALPPAPQALAMAEWCLPAPPLAPLLDASPA